MTSVAVAVPKAVMPGLSGVGFRGIALQCDLMIKEIGVTDPFCPSCHPGGTS